MLIEKKERLLNVGLHIFFVIIICISALWGIERNTTITILTDEFAYWTSAAWLNGRDWSAVMYNYPYYGYGYGFLLALFMKVFHDVRLMYQMALVMNAGMLVCSYFFAYKCWIALINHNKCQGMLGAFMAVIYSSNILYSRLTFVEVFFGLLFWILIWLCITMCHSRLKKLLFCMTLMLLLASHNRALGIIAAFVLSILICWNKEESKKEKLELFIFLLLTCFLSYVGKKYFQSVLYPISTDSIMEITDTAGQVSKIKFLLSWNGLFSFLISFLGKTYYVFVSSFLIVGYGCVYAIRKIICCFKWKKWTELFPYFFTVFSFLAVLCISAIYFAPSYQYRMDTLLYGRYHECLMGPLILFGIAELMHQKNDGKEMFYIVFAGVLLTIVTEQYIPRNQSITNFGINCVGLSDLLYKTFSITETIYTALLRGIVFIVLLYVLKSRKGQWYKLSFCCFGFLAACWIYIALFDADVRIYKWTEETVAFNNTLIADVEQDSGIIEKIYFYQLGSDNYNASYLQFLRPDAEIIYLKDKTELENLEEGTIVFTEKESDTTDTIFPDEQQYGFVSSNYYFTTWRKKSN